MLFTGTDSCDDLLAVVRKSMTYQLQCSSHVADACVKADAARSGNDRCQMVSALICCSTRTIMTPLE